MMPASSDGDFLEKTYYAWNTQGFFSDILEFLHFSEANIEQQWRGELQTVERRVANEHLEDDYAAHLRENINARFGSTLSQRLRYAVLCAIVTTAEWTAVLYGRYAVPPIPPNPKTGKSDDPVHILSELNKRAALGLESEIAVLQNLIYVRNCVTHNAGLLREYRHESTFPEVLKSLEGFSLSDNPWVGPEVEIGKGVLDKHIQRMKDWMTRLVEECTKRGFIRHA